MPKWTRPDPDAAWKAIMAELLPEVRAQTDALIASWGDRYPADWSKQISRIVRPIISDRYPIVNRDTRVAGDMVIDTITKPHYAIVNKQRRDAERAAEALVDTNRPVLASTIGHSRERIGSLAIVTTRMGAQVLVCVASDYDAGDPEAYEDAGWRSAYAAPNEAESASPEYAVLTAQIAADSAHETAAREAVQRRIARETAEAEAWNAAHPDLATRLHEENIRIQIESGKSHEEAKAEITRQNSLLDDLLG